MSLQDEMHSLAQGIIGSYEARVHEVADIRTAAQAQLREMDKARHAAAQQLHRDLAQAHADLARADEQRQKEARSRLSGLAAEHAAAHQEWCQLNAAMHARRADASTAPQPPPAAHKSSQAGGQGRRKSSPDAAPA